MVYKISAPDEKVIIDSNIGMQLPRGTTGERPAATTAGIIRYNTTNDLIEVSDGSNWSALGIGLGGGSTTLAGLSDVEVTKDEENDGTYLMWNNASSSWIQSAITGAGATTLIELTDVDVAEDDTINGCSLKWDNDSGKWVANSLPFSTVDIGFSFDNPSNGLGGYTVQQNSLTVGIANPDWVDAITYNPGNFHIDFNGGLSGVAIGNITGPAAGTNIYTITGTWPANSTGFPITIASNNYKSGLTKLTSSNGLIISTDGEYLWTFGDGTLTLSETGKIANNSYEWTFGADGNLTLPASGTIVDSDGNPVLGGTGDITFSGIQIIGTGTNGELGSGSIELVPDSNYYGNGTYLIVEPGVPNHIHLKPGTNGSDDIRILFGDRNHLSISDVTDTISITSNVGTPTKFIGFINNSGTDDFNAIPGDTLHVTSVISGAITDGMRIYCEEILPPEGVIVSFGSVTGTNGNGGPGTYHLAGQSISMNFQTFYGGTTNPIRTWTFGNDGLLTLPYDGMINYTPAESTDWSGTAPTTIQEALDRIASAIKAINSTGA